MYLEKLELQGFKSFANKNKLIFSGIIDGQKKRGLTAVVGPNGSGKSNIADSIRWVLGEQSMKTLRGKKSDDIIFSGSDKKNQLGMAEVSLYLKNDQREKYGREEENNEDWQKILLTQPEIIITRRIFRNGNSEYLINGNRSRLSDIQMLLAKANVGQKTYSVIGQGMVESFLNTNASERKDFFDEATGVKQYQIKREQAMSKLESSYENLGQVELLLGEIRPRLKTLTRHMERLKRREELEEELKEKQSEYFGALWHEINGKLDAASEEISAREQKKSILENKLSETEKTIEHFKSKLGNQADDGSKQNLSALQEKKIKLVQKIARLQAELETQLEAQGQFDVSWLNNKQQELTQQISKTAAEIAIFDFTPYQEKQSSLEKSLAEIQVTINTNENQRKRISSLRQEQDVLTKKINRLEATLEAHLEAQGQFDVSWLNNKQQELIGQIEKTLAEIAIIEKNGQASEKESLASEKIKALELEIGERQSELNRKNSAIKAKAQQGSNKEKLVSLIDNFIAKLDEINNENDASRIKNKLSEARKQFEKEIKNTINGYNEEEMKEIQEIQHQLIMLSEKKQEEISLLNEAKLTLSSQREKLALLKEKKDQLDRELSEIKDKLAKSQVKFDAGSITREKEGLQKELEAVEKNIRSCQQTVDNSAYDQHQEITNAINEAKLTLSSQREKLALLKEKKDQLDRELSEIKDKLAKSQVKFDAGSITKEKEGLQKELEAVEKDLIALSASIAAKENERTAQNSQIFDFQKQAHDLQTEINTANNELQNKKIESTRLETRLEAVESDIREEGLDLITIKKTPATIAADETMAQKISKIKSQLEMIGGIDPDTGKEYTETKERHDFLDGQTKDLNEATNSLEKIIKELDGTIKDQFDKEFNQIAEKFSQYFKILFNGGQAKIIKIETDEEEKDVIEESPNILDANFKKLKNLRKQQKNKFSGIEIQATPPGKKISTISMLSGGEKALTAIALICAIISSNPSPFVVLDEVDAALDEANSERLAQILDDLADKTQFIVITHNRASMKRASMLYGVTMQADGVSQLLSVKLENIRSK